MERSTSGGRRATLWSEWVLASCEDAEMRRDAPQRKLPYAVRFVSSFFARLCVTRALVNHSSDRGRGMRVTSYS